MDGQVVRESVETQDPELLMARLGLEAEFRQLAPGPFHASVQEAHSMSAGVRRLDLARATHQQGRVRTGYATVGVPNLGGVRRVGRRSVSHGTLLCFHHKDGFDCVAGDGLRGAMITVELDLLAREAERMEVRLPDGFLSGEIASVGAPPDMARALHQRVSRAVTAGTVEEIELGIPRALISLVGSLSPRVKTARVLHRDRALRRALHAINTRPDEMFRVEELCDLVDANPRSLDRAFIDHFGTSTKRYLVRLQLNRLRRAMFRAPGDATLKSIARGLGFNHTGQLAKDYRALFGELPSSTLGYAQRMSSRSGGGVRR